MLLARNILPFYTYKLLISFISLHLILSLAFQFPHPLYFPTLLWCRRFYLTYGSFLTLFSPCFFPLLTCMSATFPSSLLLYVSISLGLFFIISSMLGCYHLFSTFRLPLHLFYFPFSVYSLFSNSALTSVIQAHCLFSVLSETLAETVWGSYQPQ